MSLCFTGATLFPPLLFLPRICPTLPPYPSNPPPQPPKRLCNISPPTTTTYAPPALPYGSLLPGKDIGWSYLICTGPPCSTFWKFTFTVTPTSPTVFPFPSGVLTPSIRLQPSFITCNPPHNSVVEKPQGFSDEECDHPHLITKDQYRMHHCQE